MIGEEVIPSVSMASTPFLFSSPSPQSIGHKKENVFHKSTRGKRKVVTDPAVTVRSEDNLGQFPILSWQSEIGRSQNVLDGIGGVGPSSLGSPVLGACDIQLPLTATVAEQPGATVADLQKVWEVRQSLPLFQNV